MSLFIFAMCPQGCVCVDVLHVVSVGFGSVPVLPLQMPALSKPTDNFDCPHFFSYPQLSSRPEAQSGNLKSETPDFENLVVGE